MGHALSYVSNYVALSTLNQSLCPELMNLQLDFALHYNIVWGLVEKESPQTGENLHTFRLRYNKYNKIKNTIKTI